MQPVPESDNRKLYLIQDYLKICLYLIFDTVTFYWKQEQYRNTFRNIIESEEIKNLVKVLDNFKDKQDIRELQELIHQRYLSLGNWLTRLI